MPRVVDVDTYPDRNTHPWYTYLQGEPLLMIQPDSITLPTSCPPVQSLDDGGTIARIQTTVAFFRPQATRDKERPFEGPISLNDSVRGEMEDLQKLGSKTMLRI